MSSSEEWSSDEESGGGISTPAGGASSLASLFGETPSASNKKTSASSKGGGGAGGKANGGSAPSSAPQTQAAAAAAPAVQQSTTPQVLHTCPVQAFTYGADRKANPRGPHGAVLLAFPPTEPGTPGRRALLLLAPPNNTTTATISLWGPTFSFSLPHGGQYVSIEDDAGVTWSLMPSTPSAGLALGAHLALHARLSRCGRHPNLSFSAPVGSAPGGSPGVPWTAVASTSGDTACVGNHTHNLNPKGSKGHQTTNDGSGVTWAAEDGSDVEGVEAAMAAPAGAVEVPRECARAALETAEAWHDTAEAVVACWGVGDGTYVVHYAGTGIYTEASKRKGGKARESRGKESKDATRDKEGKDGHRRKKRHHRTKGDEGEPAGAEAGKKKPEPTAEEKAAQEREKAAEKEKARKKAEEKSRAEAEAAVTAKERAISGPVIEAAATLRTAIAAHAEQQSKRTVTDIKSAMQALYSLCSTPREEGGDAPLDEAALSVLKAAILRVTKSVKPRDAEPPSSLTSPLATVTDGLSALDARITSLAMELHRDKVSTQRASEESMAMVDAVANAIARAEQAEETARALRKEVQDARGEAEQAREGKKGEENARLEEMGVVCDQWRARATSAEETSEALTTRVRQLEAELADLLSVQKNPKLKITWVPDSIVKTCLSCDKKFGKMTWRHHCRHCGRVFCGSCSSGKRTIPSLGFTSPVRVCNGCRVLLEGAGAGEEGSASDDDGGGAGAASMRASDHTSRGGPPARQQQQQQQQAEEEYYTDDEDDGNE